MRQSLLDSTFAVVGHYALSRAGKKQGVDGIIKQIEKKTGIMALAQPLPTELQFIIQLSQKQALYAFKANKLVSKLGRSNHF